MRSINQWTEEDLKELGIDFLDSGDVRPFLDIIMEDCEIRIGYRISEHKSQAELDEFDHCETQEESIAWLEKYSPNYQDIVKAEQNRIIGELSQYQSTIPGTYAMQKSEKEKRKEEIQEKASI